jgi:hypothetical protein
MSAIAGIQALAQTIDEKTRMAITAALRNTDVCRATRRFDDPAG